MPAPGRPERAAGDFVVTGIIAPHPRMSSAPVLRGSLGLRGLGIELNGPQVKAAPEAEGTELESRELDSE
jgi:hypothetical protein